MECPAGDAVASNPTLYPGVYEQVTAAGEFPWHPHAHRTDSSQAFCLSAFVPLFALPDVDGIVRSLLGTAFPEIARTLPPRRWRGRFEFERPPLLGETGAGRPTSIDVLFESPDAVVCVESKFRVDAEQGFGRCTQAEKGACRGFRGAGSDVKTGTDTGCRLEAADGKRDPRRYWQIAERYFLPEALRPQTAGEVCPFREHYQLARTFLFAAEYARVKRLATFGALTLVPRLRARTVVTQAVAFRDRALRPEWRDRVQVLFYEDYLACLRSVGEPSADHLADFLEPMLEV